jgi:tyrosinase
VSAQAGFRPLATSVRLSPLDPGRDVPGAPVSIERITLEFA